MEYNSFTSLPRPGLKRRRFTFGVLSLVFFLRLGAVSAAADEQARLGAILPLSGELAPFGEVVRKGIVAANTSGESIVFDDDACSPEKAVTAYQQLVNRRNVHFLLGPCCTSAVAAVSPLIRKNGQVAMNFCTGSEDIFAASGENIFHSQYSAQVEAAFNAKAMWDRGVRRPVVLLQESEFGDAHEQAFRRAYPGSEVVTLRYSGADRGQLKSLVLRMKSLNFDAVYVPLVETFLLGFMTEMNRAGVVGKQIFGIYSVQLTALVESEGRHVDGVIYSYPDLPTSEDAAVYFARIATEMLAREVAKCGLDTACVKTNLKKDYDFDQHGFLSSRLILKTIRDGKFVGLEGR